MNLSNNIRSKTFSKRLSKSYRGSTKKDSVKTLIKRHGFSPFAAKSSDVEPPSGDGFPYTFDFELS